MATPGLVTDQTPHPLPDEAAIAAELRALRDRIESIAEVIDTLRPIVPIAQQAPALAAMLGDTFDDVMRTAIDRGVDVERGILNGAEAALRFGATMDADKVAELEALLQSGVLDPAALHTIGDLGRALVESRATPPKPLGAMGLLKALGDPNVQSALGFLIVFAERFGRRLREPYPTRS